VLLVLAGLLAAAVREANGVEWIPVVLGLITFHAQVPIVVIPAEHKQVTMTAKTPSEPASSGGALTG
jgi:hypothetical protein